VTLESRGFFCRIQIIMVIVTLSLTYLALFLTCFYTNDLYPGIKEYLINDMSA
jgi:hypothetical protein